MGQEGCRRLLPIPGGPWKSGSTPRLWSASASTVAQGSLSPQPEGGAALGSSDTDLRPMDSGTSCPASLSDATLLRESSEVGAVCVNAHVRICAGGGLRRSSLPRRRTESVWKHDIRFTLWSSMQPLNIQYFDVTVRVGCSLV